MIGKTFHTKRVLRGAVLAAAVLAIAACAPVYRKHGYVPTPDQLAEVVPGVDTRDSVAESIGIPTSTGVLNESGYYYVATRFRHYGAAAPKPVARDLVAISFDTAGRGAGDRALQPGRRQGGAAGAPGDQFRGAGQHLPAPAAWATWATLAPVSSWTTNKPVSQALSQRTVLWAEPESWRPRWRNLRYC